MKGNISTNQLSFQSELNPNDAPLWLYTSTAFDTSLNNGIWKDLAKYLGPDFREQCSPFEEDSPEFDLDYEELSGPPLADNEINDEEQEQSPEDRSEQLSKCSDHCSTIGSCSGSHSRVLSNQGREPSFRQSFLSECWDDPPFASADRGNRHFSEASDELIDLICRLIDRTAIRLKDLTSLRVEDRLILNNFLFSVHHCVFPFESEDMAGQVERLNELY
jgi:hypothetical protein